MQGLAVRTSTKISVTLSREMAALQARDRAVEAWLRGPVLAAYEAAKADPSLLMTGVELRARLAKHRAARPLRQAPD